MRRLHLSLSTKAILLGLLTAGAGLTVGLSPLGLALEESIGLSWLELLQGAVYFMSRVPFSGNG